MVSHHLRTHSLQSAFGFKKKTQNDVDELINEELQDDGQQADSPDKKAVKKPNFGFKPPIGKKPMVTPVKD